MYILGLSNVLMHRFLYDYIINKYGNKTSLFLTDTDSLMYEIKTKDASEDFSKSKDKEMFHFSDYSAKSKYYDD